MKKHRKALLITAIIILLTVSLLPFKIVMKDGGSTEYKSLLPVYSVTRYHRLSPNDPSLEPMKGTRIEILGFEVYNDFQETE